MLTFAKLSEVEVTRSHADVSRENQSVDKNSWTVVNFPKLRCKVLKLET